MKAEPGTLKEVFGRWKHKFARKLVIVNWQPMGPGEKFRRNFPRLEMPAFLDGLHLRKKYASPSWNRLPQL